MSTFPSRDASALGVSRGTSPMAGSIATSGHAQEALAQETVQGADLSRRRVTFGTEIKRGPAKMAVSKALGGCLLERVIKNRDQNLTVLSRATTGQVVGSTALHSPPRGAPLPRCCAGAERRRRLPSSRCLSFVRCPGRRPADLDLELEDFFLQPTTRRSTRSANCARWERSIGVDRSGFAGDMGM